MQESQFNRTITHREPVYTTGLSFLENDMIFLKAGADLRPEKWNFTQKASGVYENHFLATDGNYAAFASFEHEFNKWLFSLNSGWYAHNDMENYNIQDDLRRVLSFAGVDDRLSRHNNIESADGAYSGTARTADAAREVVYRYKIDLEILNQYMRHITQNMQWSTAKYSDDKSLITENINQLNANKFLRWQLNRFFEIKKQEVFNRYAGSDSDFISTEFADVVHGNNNYGLMFFIEHETRQDNLINQFPPSGNGVYDEAIYDNAKYDTGEDKTPLVDSHSYDQANYDSPDGDFYDNSEHRKTPDAFTDINDLDPLGSVNTTLWYAPFDIKEISMTNYLGEEIVEVTVLIPEGIAYNNVAKIVQLHTLDKPDGDVVELNDGVNEFKTYQIDGLFQNGLPTEQIATLVIKDNSVFQKTTDSHELTIIGTDTWFSKDIMTAGGKQDTTQLGQTDVAFMTDTSLKLVNKHPYYADQARGYIVPSLLAKKLKSEVEDSGGTIRESIGSLSRVKYRSNSFRIKNDNQTSALGTTVTKTTPAPPLNKPLEWFEIHGGYDNTDNYANVVLAGDNNSTTGFGGISLDEAHQNGVGKGVGFKVEDDKLSIVLNLIAYATDESGQAILNRWYKHNGEPYNYKVRLEWKNASGAYTPFYDEIVFQHDASQDWDLAYIGNWLRTAQNSQWTYEVPEIPKDSVQIRITIYGENATQVKSAEYDVKGYISTEKTEEIPLSISLSDYDINLGIIAREIRHL